MHDRSRSKKLKRKLRTCAGLTGSGTLVTAAALGLLSKSHGEIVTLQLNDHISPNSELSYDIDGDGELDITFRTGVPLTSGASMRAEVLYISGCTIAICGSIIRYDSLGYSLVQPHQAGEWISNSNDLGCNDITHWLVVEGIYGPFFEPTSPRYAGFGFVKYTPDTLVYNGWAELAVTEPQPGEYELDVIAIGYETEPFTPVPAGGVVTAVTENTSPTYGLALQNTPNPFSDQTRIEFQLPSAGSASIWIYDAAGRLVKTMRLTRAQKGLNSIKWDGRDDAGRRVPSGVYFCRLEALGFTQTRKMIVFE